MFDHHAIRSVPDLDDRTALDLSGVTGELRWQALQLDLAPVGLALSLAPQWQRSDDLSGQQTESYALPLTLLADIEPIAGTLFAGFNLTVTPMLTRSPR